VENKKINLSFCIVVITFLVIFYILLKGFNNIRVNDFKEYTVNIAKVVSIENNRIRILAYRLAVQQKENEDLKNTLAETRNSLEALSKKLILPAPVAAPASVPAPVTVPAPATVPAASVTTTK